MMRYLAFALDVEDGELSGVAGMLALKFGKF